jgi:hypothetical protein
MLIPTENETAGHEFYCEEQAIIFCDCITAMTRKTPHRDVNCVTFVDQMSDDEQSAIAKAIGDAFKAGYDYKQLVDSVWE